MDLSHEVNQVTRFKTANRFNTLISGGMSPVVRLSALKGMDQYKLRGGQGTRKLARVMVRSKMNEFSEVLSKLQQLDCEVTATWQELLIRHNVFVEETEHVIKTKKAKCLVTDTIENMKKLYKRDVVLRIWICKFRAGAWQKSANSICPPPIVQQQDDASYLSEDSLDSHWEPEDSLDEGEVDANVNEDDDDTYFRPVRPLDCPSRSQETQSNYSSRLAELPSTLSPATSKRRRGRPRKIPVRYSDGLQDETPKKVPVPRAKNTSSKKRSRKHSSISKMSDAATSKLTNFNSKSAMAIKKKNKDILARLPAHVKCVPLKYHVPEESSLPTTGVNLLSNVAVTSVTSSEKIGVNSMQFIAQKEVSTQAKNKHVSPESQIPKNVESCSGTHEPSKKFTKLLKITYDKRKSGKPKKYCGASVGSSSTPAPYSSAFTNPENSKIANGDSRLKLERYSSTIASQDSDIFSGAVAGLVSLHNSTPANSFPLNSSVNPSLTFTGGRPSTSTATNGNCRGLEINGFQPQQAGFLSDDEFVYPSGMPKLTAQVPLNHPATANNIGNQPAASNGNPKKRKKVGTSMEQNIPEDDMEGDSDGGNQELNDIQFKRDIYHFWKKMPVENYRRIHNELNDLTEQRLYECLKTIPHAFAALNQAFKLNTD